jgi:hypothetical protein
VGVGRGVGDGPGEGLAIGVAVGAGWIVGLSLLPAGGLEPNGDQGALGEGVGPDGEPDDVGPGELAGPAQAATRASPSSTVRPRRPAER